MANPLSIGETKARFSSLINAVAFGRGRILIQSRGRPKAALVSVEDLRRVEGAPPGRPLKAQRLLALAQADRLRKTLHGLKLTDSVEELRHLRENRLKRFPSYTPRV